MHSMPNFSVKLVKHRLAYPNYTPYTTRSHYKILRTANCDLVPAPALVYIANLS